MQDLTLFLSVRSVRVGQTQVDLKSLHVAFVTGAANVDAAQAAQIAPIIDQKIKRKVSLIQKSIDREIPKLQLKTSM